MYLIDLSQTVGAEFPSSPSVPNEKLASTVTASSTSPSPRASSLSSRIHRTRVGHQLGRQDCDSSRTQARRGVQHPCSRPRTRCYTRPNAAPQPPRRYAKQKPRQIAFVVSRTIGLNAGRASADYIYLYYGNAALLTESLEVIQRISASSSPQSSSPQ